MSVFGESVGQEPLDPNFVFDENVNIIALVFAAEREAHQAVFTGLREQLGRVQKFNDLDFQSVAYHSLPLNYDGVVGTRRVFIRKFDHERFGSLIRIVVNDQCANPTNNEMHLVVRDFVVLGSEDKIQCTWSETQRGYDDNEWAVSTETGPIIDDNTKEVDTGKILLAICKGSKYLTKVPGAVPSDVSELQILENLQRSREIAIELNNLLIGLHSYTYEPLALPDPSKIV